MPIIIRNTEQLYQQLGLLPTDLFHFRRPTATGGQKDYSISVTDLINAIATSIGGATVDTVHFKGDWDASGNTFPEDSDLIGSGSSGEIKAGDMFKISVSGTLKDQDEDNADVIVNIVIMALIDSPGQLGANWRIFG